MPSETDVINVGLRHVGADIIVSLTDGTNSANIASTIYEPARDNLLASHPWNFATKRVKLAQSATEPTFEFDYAYPLPSDWIRTISVHDNDAGHGTVLYRMELINGQRSIVASSSDIWIRYVARVTDPNAMTPDFLDALSKVLARDFAIPITSSNTLYEQMSKAADRAIARARSTDAMGSFPELRPRGSWAASRGGWRRDDLTSN